MFNLFSNFLSFVCFFGAILYYVTCVCASPRFDQSQPDALFLCTFYLSVNVFSTKVLIGDTIFTSPNGDGTAILRGHPSHAKVSPLAVQRKYLHFSVILRPWVMVRPRESNPRPPALQSNALPTKLILPRVNDATDVKITKLFEFVEVMKVGVVFEADFIADPAILAFFGLNASLRLTMLYGSNRAESL